MMSKAADSRSPMQARHLSAISECTTDVRHLEGKANVVEDALSQVEIDSAVPSLGIDFRSSRKHSGRIRTPGLLEQQSQASGSKLLTWEVPRSSVTCLRAGQGHGSQILFTTPCSKFFTTFSTPGPGQPAVSWQSDSSGMA